MLDALMRAVLAELELLACPAAGQVGTHSKAESERAGPPPVEDRVGYWRRRYACAEDDEARKACIRGATAEVRAVKLGAHPVDDRIREARLKIGADERPIEDVMHVYRCSRATVYRCQVEAVQAGRRKPGRRAA